MRKRSSFTFHSSSAPAAAVGRTGDRGIREEAKEAVMEASGGREEPWRATWISSAPALLSLCAGRRAKAELGRARLRISQRRKKRGNKNSLLMGLCLKYGMGMGGLSIETYRFYHY